MKEETTFDLNRAIQQWRENLGQSPAFRNENLHELETHLRDSISKFQEHGLSPEEAFTLAEKRIGESYALETEFGKMNRKNVWLDRVLWMLIGIQTWGLVSTVTHSITRSALSFAWMKAEPANYPYGLADMALRVIVSGIAQIVAVGICVAICWWLITRKAPGIGAWMRENLSQRSMMVKTCIRLSFLVVVAYFLSFSLQVLPSRYLPPGDYSRAAIYVSYSNLFVGPLQIITTIVFILVLARKRLCGSRT